MTSWAYGVSTPKIDPSATHTRQFVPYHERRERFASMTANIVSLADSKASRMMRQAILHEMHRPPGDADEPEADNLQQVARSLVRNGGCSTGSTGRRPFRFISATHFLNTGSLVGSRRGSGAGQRRDNREGRCGTADRVATKPRGPIA
jgi:hypothetical protein